MNFAVGFIDTWLNGLTHMMHNIHDYNLVIEYKTGYFVGGITTYITNKLHVINIG